MDNTATETDSSGSATSRGGWFTTTHWSLVLNARDPDSPQAGEALEKLCCSYWYPLYAYVRRRGLDQESAKDLTQGFFTRLLEKNYLARSTTRERPVPLLSAGFAETFPQRRVGQGPGSKARRRPGPHPT